MAGSKFDISIATKADYKPLQAASAAQKKYREELKATQAQTKKLNRSQADLKNFAKVKDDMAKTKESIKQARLELAALGDTVAKNGGKMTAAQAKQSQAQRKNLQALTKQHDQQQAKLRALSKELKSASVNTTDFGKSQRLLEAKTVSANNELERQKKRIDRVTRVEGYLEQRRQRAFEKEQQRMFKLKKLESALDNARNRRNQHLISAGATAAYIASGAIAVKKAADVETAMVEVAKKAKFRTRTGAQLSNKASEKQLGDLQNWIVKESPNFGMSAVELANIVASGAGANVARAGREQEDLKSFSQLAAKMAVAFDGLSAEQAGDSVATWMASMQLNLKQSEELAATINHLSDNSAAKTGSITDLITRSGSIMMSAGLDHKQAAALGTAILSANGNNSEVGATAAKNMALTLTQGNAMSGNQKRVISELGLNPMQLAKDMQTDSVKALYSVIESIKSKPEERRNELVSTLFGKESIGAINPLISNSKELKRVMTASNDELAIKVSLENEYAKQQATTNYEMKRVKNTFDSLVAAMGKHLLPVINAGAGALADLMAAGVEFFQESDVLAPIIMKSVAAIALLKAGMVAWKIATTAMEITSLKRKVSEVKLGGATTRTASMAIRAAAAIDRLNASLGRTSASSAAASMGGAGYDGGGRKTRRKGGKFASLRRLGGKVPIAGAAITAGLGAYALSDTLNSDSKEKGKEIGETVGSIGGSMAGAAAGAALGSLIVPVVGTAIGGIVGAIAGEELLSFVGAGVGSQFDEAKTPKEREEKRQTKDKLTQYAALSVLGGIIPGFGLASNLINGFSDNEAAPKKIDPKRIVNGSYDGYGKKIITASGAAHQSVQSTFSPTIQITGNANKADVDQALIESEKRHREYIQTSLADRMDASMADSIPDYN